MTEEKRALRVLTFDYEPSSKRGGQELSLVDECVGLATLGHEVTLGYVVEGDLLAQHRAAGVRTRKIGALEVRADSRVKSTLQFMQSAVQMAAAAGDLVSINQYHDSLFGSAVARMRRVPLVCHLRLTPPGGFCTQWRLGLRGVTRFIAVSQAVREAWIDEAGCDPDTVDVVHDGVDMTRFRPTGDREALRRSLGLPRDAFVVVSVGRIDHSKNLEGILRFFAGLRLSAERAQLLIVGRPVSHASPEAGEQYVADLRELATSLGVASAVHWLGPRGDIPELLTAADVALLFAYKEAFGRATVEALACGTPILAHRNGATTEILTGEFSRFAVDTVDPAHSERVLSLAHSLVDLRTRDPGFADRARAHASRYFSKEAMVAGIEASFRRAVALGPRRVGPVSVRAATT